MKNHIKVDGKIIQTNKKWSHLKRGQQEFISEILFYEYKTIALRENKVPERQYNEEILSAAYKKVEEADIWIPFGEVKKFFFSRKGKYRKRIDKIISSNKKPE